MLNQNPNQSWNETAPEEQINIAAVQTMPAGINAPLKNWSQLFKDSVSNTWIRKWRFFFLNIFARFLSVLPLILIFLIYALLALLLKKNVGSEVSGIINLILGTGAIFFLIVGVLVYALNWPRACFVSAIFNPTAKKKEIMRMGRKMVWKLFWVSFLKSLIVFVGLFLFVIPGIVWAIKYGLAPYALLIEGHCGGKALKRSAELTKGYRWAILKRSILFSGFLILIQIVFVLIFFLVNLLGGLGTFFTVISFVFYLFLSLVNIFISLLTEPLEVVYDTDIYQNLLSNKTNIKNKERYSVGQKLWTIFLIILIPAVSLGVLFVLFSSKAANVNLMNYLVKFFPNNQIISSLDQAQNDQENENEFIDINSSLSQAKARERDAKIFTAVKTMSYALDSYWGENNNYPIVKEKIILGEGNFSCLDVKQGFMASGLCENNIMSIAPEIIGNLTYQSTDGGDYKMGFILEIGTAGLSAGDHIQSLSGIDVEETGTDNINNNEESFDEVMSGPDTDGDMLSDVTETSFNTDPNNPDTDNDGLSDFEEVRIYKTDPLKADTDGDGYLDGEEVQNGYNPLGPGRLGE